MLHKNNRFIRCCNRLLITHGEAHELLRDTCASEGKWQLLAQPGMLSKSAEALELRMSVKYCGPPPLGLPSACPNMITSLAPLSWFQKPLSHTGQPCHAHIRSRRKNEATCQNSTGVAKKQQSQASTLGTQSENFHKGRKHLLEHFWPEATFVLPKFHGIPQRRTTCIYCFNRHNPKIMLRIWSFMANVSNHRTLLFLLYNAHPQNNKTGDLTLTYYPQEERLEESYQRAFIQM